MDIKLYKYWNIIYPNKNKQTLQNEVSINMSKCEKSIL